MMSIFYFYAQPMKMAYWWSKKGDTFYPNRHNKTFPYFSVQPYLQSLNKSHHINNNKITLKKLSLQLVRKNTG